MASVLRRQEKNYSIRKMIRRYFSENTIVIVCILFSCILSVSVIVVEWRRESESMLKLNHFYEQMREVDTLLQYHVQEKGEENSQQVLEKICEVSGILDEVWKIPVSPVFYRDIEDLRELYRNYFENAQMICEYRMNTASVTGIRAAYEKSEKIIKLIDRNFQSLYAQILHKGEENMVRQQKMLGVGILFLVLCIGSGILSQYIVTKKMAQNITDPIIRLTEGVRRVEKKGIESAQIISLLPGTNEEVQILTDGYNAMLLRIRQQMKEQYRALQLQINPHFLFNTLNMISQIAMMGETEETVELLHCTAEYLRYILDFSDKSVPLKKELEMLEKYVYIQEKRFGERIRICFDLDESFYGLSIPCMILQPLVENAVVHGVGMYEKDARINIITKRSGDRKSGIIAVCDNGVGMENDALERLKADIFDQESPVEAERIGLHNVWKRLWLFFGDCVSMDILSEPGKGTEIRIIVSLE